MRCWVLPFAAALVFTLTSAVSRADDPAKNGVVAVLPLVASSSDLEIYSNPVARAVVTALEKKLKMRVEPISTSGKIPERVTLVIDGRIVKRGTNKVMLTATVRDPARGTREGTVSTRIRPLTEIDKLASELGAQLVPVVEKAASKPRTQVVSDNPNPNVKPVTRLGDDGEHPNEAPENRPSKPAHDTRPVVVVVPPSGTVARTVSVGPPSYAPMAAAVNRLGFAAVRSSQSGIVRSNVASSEVSAVNAEFALMIHLKEVEFDWDGVLLARGRVRVLLVDKSGTARYDRTVRTDTLVGSRGDRHAALVGFVAEQAIDIAYPALRRAMR